MTSAHTRHLAVVDGADLVGIISIGDVVKQAAGRSAEQISQMQDYMHGSYGAR
jgi:CBS domain-containing protein